MRFLLLLQPQNSHFQTAHIRHHSLPIIYLLHEPNKHFPPPLPLLPPTSTSIHQAQHLPQNSALQYPSTSRPQSLVSQKPPPDHLLAQYLLDGDYHFLLQKPLPQNPAPKIPKRPLHSQNSPPLPPAPPLQNTASPH